MRTARTAPSIHSCPLAPCHVRSMRARLHARARTRTRRSMHLFKGALAFGVFLEFTGQNSPLFTLARAEGILPSAHTHTHTHTCTCTHTHTSTCTRTQDNSEPARASSERTLNHPHAVPPPPNGCPIPAFLPLLHWRRCSPRSCALRTRCCGPAYPIDSSSEPPAQVSTRCTSSSGRACASTRTPRSAAAPHQAGWCGATSTRVRMGVLKRTPCQCSEYPLCVLRDSACALHTGATADLPFATPWRACPGESCVYLRVPSVSTQSTYCEYAEDPL
jgi:hypothetical protein